MGTLQVKGGPEVPMQQGGVSPYSSVLEIRIMNGGDIELSAVASEEDMMRMAVALAVYLARLGFAEEMRSRYANAVLDPSLTWDVNRCEPRSNGDWLGLERKLVSQRFFRQDPGVA